MMLLLWNTAMSSRKLRTDAALTGGVVVMALLTLTAVMLPPVQPPALNVAFVGNSLQFYNDLPRLMQVLSQDAIVQDSCLRGGGDFASLLVLGNGMQNKWRTARASLLESSSQDDEEIYDFGACSVPQLLLGYDDNLSEQNENGVYTVDGKNPCFQSDAYYQYRLNKATPTWDFVVLNDHSRFPAKDDEREESVQALQDYYVDFLQATGATPVFLATHAYEAANNVSSRGMGDMPTFTAAVYDGYLQYAAALNASLSVEPMIAPTGLAYLQVWQERPRLWKKLFFVDGLHPSPYGTYLNGCVLYATLFNRMPPRRLAVPWRPQSLFSRARRIQHKKNTSAAQFPSMTEASYLYSVAQRVVLEQKLPSSFILLQDM